VLRTTGHTPGHQGIVLDLDHHGPVGFLGDAAHLREGLAKDVPMLSDWNVQQKLLTYGRLRALQRAGVPVFLSHDPDDFAALPKDGEFWDWAGGPGRGRGGRPGARPGAAAEVARGTGPAGRRLGAHEAAAAEEALPAPLRGGPRGRRARTAGPPPGRCRPG